MTLLKCLFAFLSLLCLLARRASAGPGGDLNLVNLTPYDWKLTYSHSYQMNWAPPDEIRAGTNFKQYVEFAQWRDTGDCAAEASYELVGSPGPAAFTVQARQTRGKRIEIQYNEHLASLGSPENSLLDLGFDWDGAVLFVLSGDGNTPYVGAQPPAAWMQATLSTIGDKSLRQISMPLSHDAGMSEIRGPPWFTGVWHNTCTQVATIHGQLEYGARWFDIRPFKRNRSWFTGHYSNTVGTSHVGGTGRSIDDIVNDINTFTSQHPGELIVLELSHELKYARFKSFRWNSQFEDKDWISLYDKLAGINALWTPSNASLARLPSDLTTVPLTTFIQPGSPSTVLIRIPDHAPAATGPSAHAFITSHRLPWTGSYSNTNDAAYLQQDQLAKLQAQRPSRDAPPHRSTYTITQKGAQLTDVASWRHSIVGLARLAHRVLLGELWPHLSAGTYPNLLEVDHLHNRQLAAMCVAINDHFANANLGGKRGMVKGNVTGSEVGSGLWVA